MKSMTTSLSHLILAGTLLVGCAGAMEEVNAQAEQKLNDLEIAHIAYTAGAIDIRYAHLALGLSEDPEVRAFAELMIRDHTAVNNKALALVKKLNITPQDNATSRQLSQQASQIRNELVQLRGEAFAKRYAANELGYHQTVNNVVEHTFIPNAENAELKALLTSALQTFKVHEGHAKRMNEKLATAMNDPKM